MNPLLDQASTLSRQPVASPIGFNEITNRCLGNLELATRLLEKFKTVSLDEIRLIERLLAESDFDQIAVVAHRLKGAAANLAAHEMHRVVTVLEQLARESRSTEIHDQLLLLLTAWERVDGFEAPGSGKNETTSAVTGEKQGQG